MQWDAIGAIGEIVGALAVDYALGRRQLLPGWYVGLRWVLTLVVVSALILSALYYRA